MRLSNFAQSTALGVLSGAFLAIPATASNADVNLLLSKFGNSTTTSLSVPAGSAFDLSVYLQTLPPNAQSSAPQATGVDYFLKSTLLGNNANGIFTLSTQTLPSSFNSPSGLPFASTLLSPISSDIGTGLTDVSSTPLSGGPTDIADYHVLVSSGASVGSQYKISIVDNGNGQLGYAGPGPNFDPLLFTSVGSVTITVTAPTPEPVSAALFAGVGCFLMVRRRRSC